MSHAKQWSTALAFCFGFVRGPSGFGPGFKLYTSCCTNRVASSVPYLVSSFGLLQGAVNHKLVVDSGLAEADICKGWTLHSVGITVQLL